LGGYENDRYSFGPIIFAESVANLQTVHSWHHYVEQNKVGFFGSGDIQASLSIVRRKHFHTVPFEFSLEELDVYRFIVDY
jgi:hypothetical protein